MTKKTLFEDALILSVAKTIRFFVRVMPWHLSCWVGRILGNAVYNLTSRRVIAYRNLRFCFPNKPSSELKKIARRSVVNLAISMTELLRFPDLTPEYLKKHVTFTGLEKVQPYLDRGDGLIFLTGHFGNWELLNATACLTGHPLAALARTQKHPRSDAFLNSLRASQGSEIIYKGMMVRQIIRALKGGKAVGILSDQDGGRNGVFVNLFGRTSSTPRGVVMFALRANAPIFLGFIFRHDTYKHRIEMEGPLQIPQGLSEEETERVVLQQFASMLETKIRKDPTQWMWGHRRWKSTTTRLITVLSDGKAGHRNQSLAVAEALQRYRKQKGVPVEETRIKVVEVKFKNLATKLFFQSLFFLTGGRAFFGQTLLDLCLEKQSRKELWQSPANIVISAGSSVAGVNLALKNDVGAKNVVVMKPPFGIRRFDAVIAPKHDKIDLLENVFVTDKVLSLANPDRLNEESQKLAHEIGPLNGQGKIGLLVGGDTEDISFSEPLFEKNLSEILDYSGKKSALILATTSRRTPAWADARVKSALADRSRCPFLVVANESNRAGTVNGILGLCDTVLVSAESMSMVSEAIASGKRVIAFMPFDDSRLKPKYRRFLEFMKEKKQIELAREGQLVQALEQFKPQKISEESLSDEQVLVKAAQKVLG